MNPLIRRLMYGAARLRPYEAAALRRYGDTLPAGARNILEEQMRAANVIQRFSRDKLVMFHFQGKRPGHDYPLFANRNGELYVAKAALRDARSGAIVACSIVTHAGRLSTLEFGRPPRAVLSEDVECRSVAVYADVTAVAEASAGVSAGDACVARIRAVATVEDVLPPAAQRDIDTHLAQLAAAVPPDYVDLLNETNGFRSGPWRFYGTAARRVVQPDGTYTIVAESGEAALCFREDNREPEVLFYDEIDDDISVMGRVFVDSLIAVLEGESPAS